MSSAGLMRCAHSTIEAEAREGEQNILMVRIVCRAARPPISCYVAGFIMQLSVYVFFFFSINWCLVIYT